eukprot:GFYU01002082.1.p1 GENE.GFYU01002082.1~~GFYU01002082.1.p1  ORF type:complete len:1195 (-),score=419.63 GFYU01002082.1:77-3661(-)
MRSVTAWADLVPELHGNKSSVNDLCMRPDGTQLVVAVGNRVLIYDAGDGDLLHSLKGHKETVYCVAYSKDGKRFASGGADKTIIIWTSKAEGILKYSHNDSIQNLCYNPVTQQLASTTAADFGLWSPEQKSVSKHKVSSKILCSAWTNDGQNIALGMFNGVITIRDKSGQEVLKITKTAPVWTLAWNPSRDETHDILAVGCWDQTLSFYQLSGVMEREPRDLGYDPCSIGYFSNGEYLVVGGSNKKVSMYTKHGVYLTTIAEKDDWVWCCKPRPKQNYVALGCNDGTIAMCQLIFSTVHGLYQDRYAYRDYMTDVIVQHLMTEQKIRIRCRDYVKKIAVYRDRLAVQLPDRVIIYELTHDDQYDMHYRVREKIAKRLDCNLLVVTSNHIILCQEKRLLLYNFVGHKEREWILESVIRYIKVVGGPSGREGLLVGLKNGTILKIFIDNSFPIVLIKQKTSIRCLDLSASRNKLAVVDEHANLLVYDLRTKELLFQEPNANSVAWNTEMEEMLCFSGAGLLSIKTGTFPVHQQKLQGFVVGFKGSKIFCLHYVAMQTIDVPQSASLYRYLEKKDFDNAYAIACLGVTENDWRSLAMDALTNMNFTIARKAFIRVRDIRYIELLNRIENESRNPNHDPGLFMAEIMAYQGNYPEASKIYNRCGQPERAVDMFSDLGMWEEAKNFAKNAKNVDIVELMKKQATACEDTSDWKQAGSMFVAAGEFGKAINLFGERGADEELVEVARQLQKTDVAELRDCAGFFRKHKNHAYAKEIYLKLGDTKSLMEIHMEFDRWDDAFDLLKSTQENSEDVYLAYAIWLVEHDRFEEAQEMFKKAGRPEKAIQLLEKLSHNAVVEMRFKDAAYYFYLLAGENLAMIRNSANNLSYEDRNRIERHMMMKDMAEVYYAYYYIFQDQDLPFKTHPPLTIFNASRFLLSRLGKESPHGVSKVYTILALGQKAKQMQCFKLARFAYDRLQTFRLPVDKQDQFDLATIKIKAKPFKDKNEFLPNCHRCTTVNPVLNNNGDICVSCSHPFQRSYYSFEALPLVEFALAPGIGHDEADRLIKEEVIKGSQGPRQANDIDGWKENVQSNVQTLTMDDEDVQDTFGDDDLFTRALLSFDTSGPYRPLTVDRDVLKSLNKTEVFIKKWRNPLQPRQYYKLMIPDIQIILCDNCNHFFQEEDFEFSDLKCPFCRHQFDAL